MISKLQEVVIIIRTCGFQRHTGTLSSFCHTEDRAQFGQTQKACHTSEKEESGFPGSGGWALRMGVPSPGWSQKRFHPQAPIV